MNSTTRNQVSVVLAIAGVVVLAFAVLKPLKPYHPVTPLMLSKAGEMAGQTVTAVVAAGSDGETYSLIEESREHPLVLFFIQDGCPCSELADPYFRGLHTAYSERVAFLGVIDGELATAKDWSSRHHSPYPIMADPDQKLIEACGAERSAYVMLIAPGGKIEALWPGYSSAMLEELSVWLASSIGRPRATLDTQGAPTTLASGCAF